MPSVDRNATENASKTPVEATELILSFRRRGPGACGSASSGAARTRTGRNIKMSTAAPMSSISVSVEPSGSSVAGANDTNTLATIDAMNADSARKYDLSSVAIHLNARTIIARRSSQVIPFRVGIRVPIVHDLLRTCSRPFQFRKTQHQALYPIA